MRPSQGAASYTSINESGDGRASSSVAARGSESTRGRSTLVQAALAVVRSIVGPAALYMPHGFSSSGWTLGLFVSAGATIFFLLGVWRLLICWEYLRAKEAAAAAAAAAATTATAAAQREKASRSYRSMAEAMVGTWGRVVVDFCILSLQMGVCVTYFIFVAENAAEVIKVMMRRRLMMRRGDVSPPPPPPFPP